MSDTAVQSFDKLIDGWVLDQLRNGAGTFDRLLISLPGVYPSEVLNSLDRLVRADAIPALLASAARNRFIPTVVALGPANDGRPEIPIEHPLDYDWRFSSTAIGGLLELALKVTKPDDGVVMLGVPTVFVTGCETRFPRSVAILDSNPRVTAYLAETCSSGSIYNCNVSEDELPQVRSGAVIVDPPWYDDYMRLFLWAGASMCKQGGHVLFSAPPIGTRPSVAAELEEILAWAELQLGLTVIEKRRMHLPYATPFFEHNALRAAGLRNLPTDWRRADLVVLQRSREVFAPRPKLHSSPEQEFSIEETIDGVRIRVRNQDSSGEWRDPALVSICQLADGMSDGDLRMCGLPAIGSLLVREKRCWRASCMHWLANRFLSRRWQPCCVGNSIQANSAWWPTRPAS